MLAAIQAPIIMMSQNRQDAKDRLRGELDYRVNLKAELEISRVLERLDRVEDQLDAALDRRAHRRLDGLITRRRSRHHALREALDVRADVPGTREPHALAVARDVLERPA